MKNKLVNNLLVVIALFIIAGCTSKKIENSVQNDVENKDDNLNEMISSMKVTINGERYTVQLEDNETTKSFIKLLPQEYNMDELNGNEKYIFLDNTLPTDLYNPKKITAGDIMLYENNCLVIFYKSFDTQYSYTKIGHIDNLPNLGSGSVSVKFEK